MIAAVVVNKKIVIHADDVLSLCVCFFPLHSPLTGLPLGFIRSIFACIASSTALLEARVLRRRLLLQRGVG
jgi:hypothetical protein